MKHEALHTAQRYDEAIEALDIMLSKLDDSPDTQTRELRRNTEYKELLYVSMMHAPLHMEPIDEAVAKYFSWAMLSHRWESKEPSLRDVQGRIVYELEEVGGIEKLRKFCQKARDLGYRWAWSDTCCIDQNNNVELQRSVNSMFVWYRQSALTIVYLSDVPPSAKWGALANSDWNTRGWTVQEFLAPRVILFYCADWALYLNDRSPNHKKSDTIMWELEDSTGINARTLVAFRPGMRNLREKLKWASTRVTTLQEDIVYSLFGIFGVHLPVIYGETKQNALGRLLQEIVGRSGDITVLDWTGKSSDFNSCLPADITSYKASPYTLPSLPTDETRSSISKLRNTVAVELVSKLYTLLDSLSGPRFTNYRLQLPCIAFPVTKVRRRHSQQEEECFTYDIKADGLQDLLITTEDTLTQFSPVQPTPQTFLLVRPWDRHDLGLPDFSDDAQSILESTPPSPLNSPYKSPRENEPDEMDAQSRALGLIVRLGQSFGALLVAQQHGREYKRIASDHRIMACVKDMASIENMMDVRMLEIL
ncbi:heterokaryon incompatibility protein-domain-containing protein [Suillus placidus]|uniref:Heterokaryon incompatibility protein-domain-containing protein n=1 Tax=Suillus placidus TaxID=48579 RepID=A0A9P7D5K3_9AGAM|nr:heterokaryon incompatibility protein-domain-containing protein [Suillus placidus]